jgi:regulator of protease activity HflC (stomatin/prohibitin superfamily)
MSRLQQALQTVNQIAQSEQFEQFRINAEDFLSARERGEAAGTRIDQMLATLDDAAEIVNRSFPTRDQDGQFTNVISPVVIPKDRRSFGWIAGSIFFVLLGLVGGGLLTTVDAFGFTNAATTFFGPHYWLLVVLYAGVSYWRSSYVMVPDGCQALITRFGKLEAVVPAGRVTLFNPWKRVSYIVNTTREYPYNAPIREAPTASRVNASVDLFLQFKIEEPSEFIFALGGAKGFAEKLHNVISEVTRALIYEQKAEDIYDLVGESTQGLLDSLNQQFLPAVRFVNANITHAEPSSQEYRMDLAAPEMVRVAKEAYTYQYELKLRKEQDEGDLNRDLASLRETLSAIRADVATFQAQIDTAREKETHRANAYARQLLIEAESTAKANAALLEAQALDIRAVSSASNPEILQYRYQQEMLDRLMAIAERLPQVVQIGATADEQVNYLSIAQHMLGTRDETLFSDADLQAIRARTTEIQHRIQQRAQQIQQVVADAKVEPASEGVA